MVAIPSRVGLCFTRERDGFLLTSAMYRVHYADTAKITPLILADPPVQHFLARDQIIRKRDTFNGAPSDIGPVLLGNGIQN